MAGIKGLYSIARPGNKGQDMRQSGKRTYAPTDEQLAQQYGLDIPETDPTASEAFGYGVGQGVTLGMGNKGLAAVRAVATGPVTARGEINPYKPVKGPTEQAWEFLSGSGNFADQYSKRLTEQSQKLNKARQAHPGAYLAGNLAGAVPLIVATGGGSAAGMLGSGAVQGALQGAGEQAGTWSELAGNAAKGAVVGKIASGVGIGASALASAIGRKGLDKLANIVGPERYNKIVREVLLQNPAINSAYQAATSEEARDAIAKSVLDTVNGRLGGTLADVLGSAAKGAIGGAAVGATGAAMAGGDVGQAAKYGAMTGAVGNPMIRGFTNQQHQAPISLLAKQAADRLSSRAGDIATRAQHQLQDPGAYPLQWGVKPSIFSSKSEVLVPEHMPGPIIPAIATTTAAEPSRLRQLSELIFGVKQPTPQQVVTQQPSMDQLREAFGPAAQDFTDQEILDLWNKSEKQVNVQKAPNTKMPWSQQPTPAHEPTDEELKKLYGL